ncbi:UDP-galactopyranose mutase [Chryseobacterium jejuense]|uniref:UDP-galactopyranose mutase n=1 Tax=Chryseobacterium jejuense TaxID=445960 RepID=A0A2X2X877_CHRJE|nr:UDP-galactopyranose mutase [Chryseobacterium jejuense]SDJ51303.1 UDP-galactopyranose mutase [Chryseobacterium jejuense]SQB46363.1 UDP-galactopyranose mutase [Chryseobacterium jejuense]
MKYDYLIVGAGIFGSVFAYEAKKRNKTCLVIDKRNHKGGNIYCENVNGINIHKYGAHIFHTNDKEIWDYVNQFAEFNNYINSPIAFAKGKFYNLPFNMNTFYQLWGTKTPAEAQIKIQEQKKAFGKENPQNLEEQAISLVGKDIYDTLIKEYTEKQWGRKASELPSFIIRRLPVRFTFDNNYFNDKYQGIPIGGYNVIIDNLLKDIEVKTETDFFENREYFESIADKVVFTGQIDEFFGYQFGTLEYRSLKFEHETLDIENYQGNAVVNYNDAEYPFTRIIEHKHFEFGKQEHTVITREFPDKWEIGKEAYYPINDDENQQKFDQYKALAQNTKNVIFGGRLAEFRYYDMHQIIGSALVKIKKEFNEN